MIVQDVVFLDDAADDLTAGRIFLRSERSRSW